jgi:lysophospholipase L1-like esterase
MAIASVKVGVKALVPIEPRALSATYYQADGIHLNSEGAVRFTSALASDLPKIMVR